MDQKIEEQEHEESGEEQNDDIDYPLFKKYPILKRRINRITLIESSTPVTKLEGMSRYLKREVYVKRDDISCAEYGGNKPRKYELIFADILAKKYTNITTIGGHGSNHCFGSTLLAKKYGLKIKLFLIDQPLLPEVQNNLLSIGHFSPSTAELVYCENIYWAIFYSVLDILLCRRCHPNFFLEPGGSTSLGILGFVNAALEYHNQVQNGECEEVDYIFIPVGSSSSSIGLSIGLELIYGRGKGPKVIGVKVIDSFFFNSRWKMYTLCKGVIRELQKHIGYEKIPNIHEYIFERLIIDSDYLGREYGWPTKQGMDSIKILEEKEESIEFDLDPVYTSKTFSALIDYCSKEKIKEQEKILFWFTKNSIDISKYRKDSDWKDLPQEFHKLFDNVSEKDFAKPSDIHKTTNKLKKE